ncbi:MAG: TolC family protein [Treponema sp.]|jgi:outer membrane protein TolC|nr:TolC family protein [Treponema sp.]
MMIQHAPCTSPAGIRPALGLLLGLLVSASPAAQTAGNGESPARPPVVRLSPDEAVEMAVKNNLSLESASVTLDTLRRKSDLVWNQFLPDISANGTLSKGLGVFTTPATRLQGSVAASLTLSAALVAGVTSIRQDYEAGLVTFEKARVQMERDIRKLYNNMLLLEENIAMLRGSFAAAQQREQMAGENYRAGLVPELSWLQARVSMENMRPSIDQVENQYRTGLAGFAIQLGLPYDTQFELVPVEKELDFIPLDTAELIAQAASGNMDIYELQRNIIALKSRRRAMALQLWTPYLTLGWNYSPNFLADPWKNSWADGKSWLKGGSSFSITLGISVNSLFPFTKEGQGLKDLDNSVRDLTIKLAQVMHGTELDVYSTVLSLDRIRTTAMAQRMTVDLADQSYRLTEEAYRAGLQDFLEVQNAEVSLRQARVQMLEHQFNYLNGLIDLEYATGVPFGTLSSREEGSAGTEGRN